MQGWMANTLFSHFHVSFTLNLTSVKNSDNQRALEQLSRTKQPINILLKSKYELTDDNQYSLFSNIGAFFLKKKAEKYLHHF